MLSFPRLWSYILSPSYLPCHFLVGTGSPLLHVLFSGRAWKSFIRSGMKGKTQQVQIHHIKAHEGVESLSQRGNDAADKVAKEYMTRGEVDTALKNWKALKPADQEIPETNPHPSQGNMAVCHSLHGWSGLDLFHFCNLPSATD